MTARLGSEAVLDIAAHEAAAPLSTRSRNNFNLLRMCLALLVIVSHVPELMDGNRSRELLTRAFGTLSFGEFAVDGFFVLSGFLIVQSWQGSTGPLQYLRKRALRIYPAFLIAFFVSAVVVGAIGAGPEYWHQLSFPTLLRQALTLQMPGTPPTFAGLPYPMVNGALWTIRLEFQCYLLVLVLGLAGVVGRRPLWLALTLAAGLAFLASRFGLRIPVGSEGIGFESQRVRLAFMFMTGGSFFLYREYLHRSTVAPLVAAAALVLLMPSTHFAELALAVLGGYILLRFATSDSGAISHYNRLPDVSYGVYLWAWPITNAVQWTWPGLSVLELGLATVAGAVAIGTVSWYTIEKPALTLK